MAKILVIDDEKSVRDILKRILEGAGYEAVCIDDGLYAKKAIQEHRPDLIICDIIMPGLDGHAPIYHLKFESEFKNIPVMILTSLGDEKSYLGKEVAADYYMAKPIDQEKIIRKVKELLSSGRVKAGVRQDFGDLPTSRETNKTRAVTMMLLSLAVIVILLVFRYTGEMEMTNTNTGIKKLSESQSVSILSDKLFIYIVPIALLVFLYQTYLLLKIASKK
ncbi:MAG: response regulator [bacterium]